MNIKDLRNLMEAYSEVHAPQEEIEEAEYIDEAEGSYGRTPKATAAYGALANKRRETPASGFSKRGEKTQKVASAEKHMRRSERPAGGGGKQSTRPYHTAHQRQGMTQKKRTEMRGQDEYGHTSYDSDSDGPASGPGGMPKGKKLERQRKRGVSAESYDIFDVVLEFLQAEGFAETLEEAEWLMANVIDEEAIEIILGEEQLNELSDRKLRAYIKKSDKSHAEINKKWDQGTATDKEKNKSIGHEIGQRRAFKTLDKRARKEEFEAHLDEAQVANRDPEKYEAGEKKKYAPVRGERTPMPPRGDKRREDFEKWYRANVR
jgi:hypothetical protein